MKILFLRGSFDRGSPHSSCPQTQFPPNWLLSTLVSLQKYFQITLKKFSQENEKSLGLLSQDFTTVFYLHVEGVEALAAGYLHLIQLILDQGKQHFKRDKKCQQNFKPETQAPGKKKTTDKPRKKPSFILTNYYSATEIKEHRSREAN